MAKQLRLRPYTQLGISRVKCFRCGKPSAHQWQVCADGGVYRAICDDCDIALNKMVLTWMGDPDVEKKMSNYLKERSRGA